MKISVVTPNMMKRIRKPALALLMAFCFALSGCQEGAKQIPDYFLNQESAGPSLPDSEPSGESESPQQLTFELTPEQDPDMIQGKLIFTLTGARVVTREQDIPEGGIAGEPAVVFNGDGTETIYSCREREFIREDGSFVDGVYMILLDVTVESQDFLYKTKDEKGPFYDPYLFRSQFFFWIKDPNDGYGIGSARGYYNINFYSGFGENVNAEDRERYEAYNVDNYNLAVRILPGESKSITLGYVIGNNLDGTPRNLEDLCAVPIRVYGERHNKILINLGLKNP